ncbi:MAG: sodium/solute symporter [Planctomycetota bacterium]|nr:sodium/solute symporter [Planctomycetota bacterium]
MKQIFLFLLTLGCMLIAGESKSDDGFFQWTELQPLPDELGFAGPFAGVHDGTLLVAGGANFPKPIWDAPDQKVEKAWHDRIFALKADGKWVQAGRLDQPVAYGAAVSTPFGVLCMGGNCTTPGNEAEPAAVHTVFSSVFLLRWDDSEKRVTRLPMADLPRACAYGYATLVGNSVYLVGGTSGKDLQTAMKNVWRLDLPADRQATDKELGELKWQVMEEFPGPARAFNITVAQHNGFNDAIYVISGRRQNGDQVEFLKDCWALDLKNRKWQQKEDVPRCVMAGTGIAVGQSHILVAGGADGSLWGKAEELKDRHPGFPAESLLYHTITNTWTPAGKMPANHVTTIAVRWRGKIIIPTGEIRPRVRSPKVWSIEIQKKNRGFGTINYIVLVVYLVAIVGVGVWFTRRADSTDQFFRGGKSIPWWVAGCSIFATMLSSLTYTGVPAKSYAQDWVYAMGNFMIPLVAIVAVLVALPFFRRIDATSAYEYLEKRFNYQVRLLGSASFTCYHIFRMAVVMSLTALALSVATPLTPSQSVLLMGALSILYCALGGIEAVVWTDTVQTVVLLGGALFAFCFLLGKIDTGWSGFVASASDADKFNIANFHVDPTNAQIALWVIILGGIGQNISSYTSDQAVVQRYMTTPDARRAARSIWTNALLTIPATLLFFGMGTALFVYYRQHPEQLDPSATTDQIFPMFIANSLPVGVAGLLVAGIFAAAQSTVSTSMNSTATSIVTDFLKPFHVLKDDRQYLMAARMFTVLLGIAGTGFALLFISPDIKSLFDEFIKVIGLFMGVLGGLFVLGVMTKRANGTGALVGGIVGAVSMFALWKLTPINGYLYTTSGIVICFVVGYLVSLLLPAGIKPIDGLTIYDLYGADHGGTGEPDAMSQEKG